MHSNAHNVRAMQAEEVSFLRRMRVRICSMEVTNSLWLCKMCIFSTIRGKSSGADFVVAVLLNVCVYVMAVFLFNSPGTNKNLNYSIA